MNSALFEKSISTQIVPFIPHYQFVYVSFDFSSFSLISYQRKCYRMKKTVYLAGSIRGGREDAAVYKRMIDYINKTDIVLTEHIGLGNLSVMTRTKEDDVHIYERDTEWIRVSDVLIAECTSPSHGVGYELAYAEARNIPVHIFYDKSRANVSAMLNGNTRFKLYPYEREAEIYPVLDNILGNK